MHKFIILTIKNNLINQLKKQESLFNLAQFWKKSDSLMPFSSLFLVIKSNLDAKRLYDDLFSNYNHLVRPVTNDSQPVKVQIKLKLSQLIEVVS